MFYRILKRLARNIAKRKFITKTCLGLRAPRKCALNHTNAASSAKMITSSIDLLMMKNKCTKRNISHCQMLQMCVVRSEVQHFEIKRGFNFSSSNTLCNSLKTSLLPLFFHALVVKNGFYLLL